MWLWGILSDGEKPVNQIYELGKAQGYSERTIDRTKTELEVGSKRVGFGKEGHIVWNLPLLSRVLNERYHETLEK